MQQGPIPQSRDVQPRRVSEHSGTKKDPRNMQHWGIPRGCFWFPWEGETPGRGLQGLSAMQLNFPGILEHVLCIHGGGSLTSAGTRRVKLF